VNENQDTESVIVLSAAVAGQLPTISGTQLKVYVYLCASYHGELFSATMEQIAKATGLKRRAVSGAVKALWEKNLVLRLVGKGGEANQYSIPLDAPREIAVTSQDEALREDTPPAANPIGVAMAASVAGLEEVLSNVTKRLFSCILRQGAVNSGQRIATAAAGNSDDIGALSAGAVSVEAVEAPHAGTASCAKPEDGVLREATPDAANPIGGLESNQSTPAGNLPEVPTPSEPPETGIISLITARYRQINEQELAEIRAAFPNEVDLRQRLARFCGVAPEMCLGFFLGALDRFA